MQNACGEGSFFLPVSKSQYPCGKDTGLQGLSGAHVAVWFGACCAPGDCRATGLLRETLSSSLDLLVF